jgi:hypothetical protein
MAQEVATLLCTPRVWSSSRFVVSSTSFEAAKVASA